MITGRNLQKLEDAKEELERLYGIQVLPVQADVNAGTDNEAAVANVVKQAIDTFGRIDVLINNAQASASGVSLADHTTEQFNLALYSGLYAVFYYMKACYPYLKETKGVILNTSSMVSIYGQPSGVMYPTTKFAVNGITKSLARELAPQGIRVNAVAPGIINTDMVAQLPKEMIEPLIKTIPFGRIGEPEDIANAFLFLSSNLSSYITGVVLSVDGLARS